MGYADLIRKLQALPRDKQAEVFDFVDFLASRCVPAEPDDWPDGEFAALSLDQAMRGMEDDPVTYGLEDLKEVWRLSGRVRSCWFHSPTPTSREADRAPCCCCGKRHCGSTIGWFA